MVLHQGACTVIILSFIMSFFLPTILSPTTIMSSLQASSIASYAGQMVKDREEQGCVGKIRNTFKLCNAVVEILLGVVRQVLSSSHSGHVQLLVTTDLLDQGRGLVHIEHPACSPQWPTSAPG